MKVMCATPCHRGDVERCMAWMYYLFTTCKVEGCGAVAANCPWLDAARANLVAAFLNSDCTHIFFRDDDVDVEPADFERVLDAAPTRDVVQVPYRQRTPPHAWVTQGLGLTVIARGVLEQMAARYPELRYYQDGSPRVALFHPLLQGEGKRRVLLKEDAAFWYRAKESGFEPYLLTGVEITHGSVRDTYQASTAPS